METIGPDIPWINRIAFTQIGELSENSARTIAAVAIWLSVAMILTFGVFRLNWPGAGAGAVSVMMILVVVICTATSACTAIVYGWKPWTATNRIPSEKLTA
jgi:hypothetical protein